MELLMNSGRDAKRVERLRSHLWKASEACALDVVGHQCASLRESFLMSVDNLVKICRAEVEESGWISLSSRRAMAKDLSAEVAIRIALRLGRLIRSSLRSSVDERGPALRASLGLLDVAESADSGGPDDPELLAERDLVANALVDAGQTNWAEASAGQIFLAVADVVLYGFHVPQGTEERQLDRETWDVWFWGALYFAGGFPWERHDTARVKEFWTMLLDIVAHEVVRQPTETRERYEGAYEGRPPHMACVLVREGRDVRKVLRVHELERRGPELFAKVEALDALSGEELSSLVVDIVWVRLMGESEDLVATVILTTIGENGEQKEGMVRVR